MLVRETISDSCHRALGSGGKSQHIPDQCFMVIRLFGQFDIGPDECFAECYWQYFGSIPSFSQESVGAFLLSFDTAGGASDCASHTAC